MIFTDSYQKRKPRKVISFSTFHVFDGPECGERPIQCCPNIQYAGRHYGLYHLGSPVPPETAVLPKAGLRHCIHRDRGRTHEQPLCQFWHLEAIRERGHISGIIVCHVTWYFHRIDTSIQIMQKDHVVAVARLHVQTSIVELAFSWIEPQPGALVSIDKPQP